MFLLERLPGKNKTLPMHCIRRVYVLNLLTRQGSNLDSSEPKSDVLPITPRVNRGRENRVANIQNKAINL